MGRVLRRIVGRTPEALLAPKGQRLHISSGARGSSAAARVLSRTAFAVGPGAALPDARFVAQGRRARPVGGPG